MNDFFGRENENKEEVENLEEGKIKLGDKEYSQEELDALVGLGQKAREYEKRYNTDFEKAWSAYGRTTQENAELKRQLEQAEIEKSKPRLPEDQEEQARLAREAAKKIGLLTRDDLAELGIVTEKDFSNYYKKTREAEQILNGVLALEKEYNGTDGRPRFVATDMLEYMRDTGIQDPKAAYKIRYEEALDTWRQTQMDKVKKPGLVTETGSTAGSKQPPKVKVTSDNLSQLLAEQLYKNQE